MLNPEENRLVIQAIKDKRDNYAVLIQKESAKPLDERDVPLINQLTNMYHRYDGILEKVQGVCK